MCCLGDVHLGAFDVVIMVAARSAFPIHVLCREPKLNGWPGLDVRVVPPPSSPWGTSAG